MAALRRADYAGRGRLIVVGVAPQDRPDRLTTEPVRRQIARAFGVLIAAMAAMVAVALVSVVVMLGIVSPAITKARAAALTVASAQAGMLNEEAGLRGWIGYDNQQFLRQYQQGEVAVAAADKSLTASPDPVGHAVSGGLIAAQLRWEHIWAADALRQGGLGPGSAMDALLLRGTTAFQAYQDEESASAAQISAERKNLTSQMVRVAAGAAGTEIFFAAIGIWVFRRRHQLENSDRSAGEIPGCVGGIGDRWPSRYPNACRRPSGATGTQQWSSVPRR